jgi:polysaccharide deacetylase 2 family uncharacterized protein YibQ
MLTIAVLLGFIVGFLSRSQTDRGNFSENPADTFSRATEGEHERMPWHSDGIDDNPSSAIKPHEAHSHEERPEKVVISVVIDDVGYSIDELERFLDLPGKLTFAVLPHLPLSTEAARMIRNSGNDVILHMPMEAIDGSDPGPGAIMVADSPETIREKVISALATVPGAIGMNNHMGSKVTADEHAMKAVLETVKERGLFFLDSRTTTKTKVPVLARPIGLEYIGRNIFLDNDPTLASVRAQFEHGLEFANKSGTCIFIGHVQHPAVAEILRQFLPLMPKKSYTLTTLKTMAWEKKTS